MTTDTNGGHKDDTSKVSLWVPKNVLARWDAFCTQEGIKRTALLINAANEWIRTHSTDAKSAIDLAALKEERDQLVGKMDKVLEGIATESKKAASSVDDIEMKDRVVKFLQREKDLGRSPIHHSEMATIMGMDVNDLVTILGVLKDDKLVSRNKKGEWFLNDN